MPTAYLAADIAWSKVQKTDFNLDNALVILTEGVCPDIVCICMTYDEMLIGKALPDKSKAAYSLFSAESKTHTSHFTLGF